MHHVPNDMRALKSVEKIYRALRDLLLTKQLDDISVTDITCVAGISRATFYRLFDNVSDVLILKLEEFIDEYFREYNHGNKLLNFFTFWSLHTDYIYILSKQAEYILKNTFKKYFKSNTVEDIYLLEAQTSILSSILCKWAERKKKETPEQMCQICKKIFKDNELLITLFI